MILQMAVYLKSITNKLDFICTAWDMSTVQSILVIFSHTKTPATINSSNEAGVLANMLVVHLHWSLTLDQLFFGR